MSIKACIIVLSVIVSGCSAGITKPETYSIVTNSVILSVTNDRGNLAVVLQNQGLSPLMVNDPGGPGEDPQFHLRLYKKNGEFCAYTEQGDETMSMARWERTGRNRPERIGPNDTRKWVYDLREGFQYGSSGKFLLEIDAYTYNYRTNQVGAILEDYTVIKLGRVPVTLKKP